MFTRQPTALLYASGSVPCEEMALVWSIFIQAHYMEYVYLYLCFERSKVRLTASMAMVLERFEHSPQKSTKKCACETGISRTSVRCIIKTAKLKVFIPRLDRTKSSD